MNEEIFNRIKQCILQNCEDSSLKISSESSLREDLKMDSLHLVMLQIALEEEFCFTFDPLEDDFHEILNTVSSLEKFILGKIQ